MALPEHHRLPPWEVIRRRANMTLAMSHTNAVAPADDPTAGDVTVLIVDDQAPFRSAARTVVAMASGFTVIGEAETGEQAISMADDLHPALILMDINLPGISGIEATRRIIAANGTTKVILLSTYTADDLPADARTCGAADYVHKEDFSPTLLAELWRS